MIGGRILHGESVRDACERKTLDEVGLAIVGLRFLGLYEDMFDKNSFQVPEPYHTLSFVFETCVTTAQNVQLDAHHSAWDWFDRLPDRFAYSLNGNGLPELAPRGAAPDGQPLVA